MMEIDSTKKAKQLCIDQYKKHIFLCVGPECCSQELGEEVWIHLKKRLSELKLAAPGGSGSVYRTRAACLRICGDGPIAVVYPDAVWYRKVDKDVMDKIINDHLVNGLVVEESVLAKNSDLQKEIKSE